MTLARNPRAEAEARLDPGLVGRVLEPSPPAVDDAEWYADDPVNAVTGPGRIVAPVGGDLSWNDQVTSDPELVSWAAEHWLIDEARLPPMPVDLGRHRNALHRLATYVIAPARHQANGKFGLRWTAGGFGTPFFGPDRQVRVEDNRLVVQQGETAQAAQITSLRAAAELIGSEIDTETASEHDSPPVGDIDEDLGVSAEAAHFLGAWWGLGTAALERLRADPASVDPSRVQLWPGHFDPAIEAGDEDRRASFGASPGDHSTPEPYLYVSVWWPDRLEIDAGDRYWNAEGYVGALLPYRQLAKSESQIATALEFFRTGRDRLVAARKVG